MADNEADGKFARFIAWMRSPSARCWRALA
jgi:hypothetical protein